MSTPLPPVPPGSSPRRTPDAPPGRRRSLLWGALAALLAIVLVVGVLVAFVVGNDGDEDQAGGGSDSATTDETDETDETDDTDDTDDSDDTDDTDEPEETETPDEPLEEITPIFSYELGAICDGTAVLAGGTPYPSDPANLVSVWLNERPAATPPLAVNPWSEVFIPEQGGKTPELDWSAVNAVVCLSVVEDSEATVSRTCEGTLPDGTQGTWEEWGGEYFFQTRDVTTGEIVDESEPFLSAELEVPEALVCAGAFRDPSGDDFRTPDLTILSTQYAANPYLASLLG